MNTSAKSVRLDVDWQAIGHGAVSIRLPQDLSNRLDVLAERTGRSKTYYIREAIAEHLAELEDLYLAEQRLLDINAGKTKTVTLDEVMKRYSVED